MKQRFYLEQFERYRKRGLEKWNAGKAEQARQDLLRAAEMLFKLAAASTGELRQVRKQKAREMLEQARGISAETTPASGDNGKMSVGKDKDEVDSSRWVVNRSTGVSMEDVAGLDRVKNVIRRRVIRPFTHPEATRRYKKQAGGGVLLYGPPGTGKTMMAKAVANEIDATFFSVKCSDIISKWVGEAERNLRELFQAARNEERAVVFLDETEAICAKRGSGSTVMDRLIPEFLSQVDGLEGRHQCMLMLGATNRPWDMDEAALRPGRFGDLIYVTLPDRKARYAILASHLTEIPLAEGVELDELADRTEGYSGADLVAVCGAITDGPYDREIETGLPQQVEPEDVDYGLGEVRRSVTEKQLRRYEKFDRDRT